MTKYVWGFKIFSINDGEKASLNKVSCQLFELSNKKEMRNCFCRVFKWLTHKLTQAFICKLTSNFSSKITNGYYRIIFRQYFLFKMLFFTIFFCFFVQFEKGLYFKKTFFKT